MEQFLPGEVNYLRNSAIQGGFFIFLLKAAGFPDAKLKKVFKPHLRLISQPTPILSPLLASRILQQLGPSSRQIQRMNNRDRSLTSPISRIQVGKEACQHLRTLFAEQECERRKDKPFPLVSQIPQARMAHRNNSIQRQRRELLRRTLTILLDEALTLDQKYLRLEMLWAKP